MNLFFARVLVACAWRDIISKQKFFFLFFGIIYVIIAQLLVVVVVCPRAITFMRGNKKKKRGEEMLLSLNLYTVLVYTLKCREDIFDIKSA